MRFAWLRRLSNRNVAVVTALTIAGGTIALNALYFQSGKHPAPLFVTRDRDAPKLTAAPHAPAGPRPDLLVQLVQSGLVRAGLYSGPRDGVNGPSTRAAIEAFERRNGRRVTGQASPELLAALDAANRGPTRTNSLQGPASTGSIAKHGADPKVAAVQQALSQAAYGPLVADGVFGPQTGEAIARFQKDRGLPTTGAIDARLIAALVAIGAMRGT